MSVAQGQTLQVTAVFHQQLMRLLGSASSGRNLQQGQLTAGDILLNDFLPQPQRPLGGQQPGIFVQIGQRAVHPGVQTVERGGPPHRTLCLGHPGVVAGAQAAGQAFVDGQHQGAVGHSGEQGGIGMVIWVHEESFFQNIDAVRFSSHPPELKPSGLAPTGDLLFIKR
ncbi:MAG: hypothetical protein P8X63_14580 [Desulfuromonadaceae bacterium]